MPRRVIDFDAMWASDKLASCPEWAQTEYAWLYGLADSSGSFEMTNLRVIWGRVAAIRRNLALERLEQVFAEFIARGLLFTWEDNGKRYGHWTGSEVPGRLPPPSWRARYEQFAPPVPRAELAAYVARFSNKFGRGTTVPAAAPRLAEPDGTRDSAHTERTEPLQKASRHMPSGLKASLESPQAQDLELDLDRDLDSDQDRNGVPEAERENVQQQDRAAMSRSTHETDSSNSDFSDSEDLKPEDEPEFTPEALLAIYEAERGSLPAAGKLNPKRLRKCALLLAAGVSPGQFREAVRHATSTPFLSGGGLRGWRANFDWLIADAANIRRILRGQYGRGQYGASSIMPSSAPLSPPKPVSPAWLMGAAHGNADPK